MPVNIVSTTDTPEEVQAAIGNKVEAKITEKKVETKSATESKETVETKVASEAATENDTQVEAKEDESDEAKVEREAKEAADAKAKRKGGFQKKISKLTAKVSEAEKQALYWRDEALKAQKPAEKTTETKVEAKADGKPDPEKFANHTEYVEALADWKVDQRLSADKQKSNEAALKSESQKKISTHVERVNSFKKDHADFNDLMEDVNDIPMSLTVQQVILDSENGPELMYELAKNKEEYEKICKLPAIAAARELGRFEAKIAKSSTASQETKETKTTKAPAPISPVTKGKVTAEKDPEKMTQREYNAWRDAGGGR